MIQRKLNKPKLRISMDSFDRCPILRKLHEHDLTQQIEKEVVPHDDTFTLRSDIMSQSSCLFEMPSETPDFSQRLVTNKSANNCSSTDLQKTSSSRVLKKIKQQFQHFNNNPNLQSQLKSVNRLLQQIQHKLSNCLPRFSTEEELDFIKKSPSQCSTMGGILYTNFNLTDFVDEDTTPKRRRSSLLGLENVDNIQYLKILYLLGEAPQDLRRYPKNSVFSDIEAQSPTVKELNLEIQMLNNILKLKNEKIRKGQSLQSTRNITEPNERHRSKYQQKTNPSPFKEANKNLFSRTQSKINIKMPLSKSNWNNWSQY